MSSTITALTSGGGLAMAGDTSGQLELKTNNGTTAVTISTAQNVGIGGSPVANNQLTLYNASFAQLRLQNATSGTGTSDGFRVQMDGVNATVTNHEAGYMAFETSDTERMRIDTSGNLLVGKTSPTPATVGCEMRGNGIMTCTRSAGPPLSVNRTTDDGDLVSFQQDGTQEGSISVSGTTVSYNGGHLSRWSQLIDGSKDDTILKGTVMSNLDDMCVWEKDGVIASNEQLNKMKVSDVEGDTNVAGVFVNWTMDEEYGVDDLNVAMTGDMIIRIAEGVVVEKGELLISAGDGTAKPQGDDIRKSKTIAKVTSNYVTCTYADGSYCVPCVLMAC